MEDYQKNVKQPMDFGTVKNRLDKMNNTNGYASPAAFSKDVNRVFSNVMKVWEAGQEIFDAAQRLQFWWVQQWTELVPRLMSMKADCDHEQGTSKPEVAGGDNDENASPNLVERGEDYQEQLGMPDEENMRSWSHHHSTDTVDDPIFRAAMHGYDAVSFVFGLEVTWSLIQERQQEDEERRAMEELEKIDELDEAFEATKKAEKSDDGEEESESGEESGECEDEGKVEKEDDASNPVAKRRKKIGVDNDDDTNSSLGDEDDGNEMADFIAEDSDEDEDGSDEEAPLVASDVQSEDSSEEEKEEIDEEKEEIEEKEEVKEVEEEADVEMNEEDPVNNDAPRERPGDEESNKWACSQCTFLNEMRNRSCEVCRQKKPRSRRRRS
jgi:hypothetical protein